VHLEQPDRPPGHLHLLLGQLARHLPGPGGPEVAAHLEGPQVAEGAQEEGPHAAGVHGVGVVVQGEECVLGGGCTQVDLT